MFILINGVSSMGFGMFATFPPTGIMIYFLLKLAAHTRIVLLSVDIGLLVIVLVSVFLVAMCGSIVLASAQLSFNSTLRKTSCLVLSYIPHVTTRNIKWYDYNTGHIGTTNHVLFDEDINDLTYDDIPPNQRDLERVE